MCILGEEEWTRDWEQYSEFKEKDTLFFMFYISEESENCNIIPKRIFNSDEEILTFRSFLNRKGKGKRIFLDLKY